MNESALTPELTAFARAIDLAGGQTELARRLREVTGRPIKQSHVWNWLNRQKFVPPEYVIPIERIVEAQVTRYELRPDIYPREGKRAS